MVVVLALRLSEGEDVQTRPFCHSACLPRCLLRYQRAFLTYVPTLPYLILPRLRIRFWSSLVVKDYKATEALRGGESTGRDQITAVGTLLTLLLRYQVD